MAIYKRGVIQPLVTFLGVEILITFCGIIFDPGMLESQTGALKTRRIA